MTSPSTSSGMPAQERMDSAPSTGVKRSSVVTSARASAERPCRSASCRGDWKVRPFTRAASEKPREAMIRKEPPGSSRPMEQESNTTMRASCLRTSSIVWSRLAWRLMASRISRRVSASTRRSRSVSTVAWGLSRRRSRAISSRTASRASARSVSERWASRFSTSRSSRSVFMDGCGSLQQSARPCGRTRAAPVESGCGRPRTRAHPLRLHRQRRPQPHGGGPLPRRSALRGAVGGHRAVRQDAADARADGVGGARLRDVASGRTGHHTQIKLRFPGTDRPVVDLDVEDRWVRGDPELIRRVLRSLRPHLGAPQGKLPEPRR